jgi:hypothetical protein
MDRMGPVQPGQLVGIVQDIGHSGLRSGHL